MQSCWQEWVSCFKGRQSPGDSFSHKLYENGAVISKSGWHSELRADHEQSPWRCDPDIWICSGVLHEYVFVFSLFFGAPGGNVCVCALWELRLTCGLSSLTEQKRKITRPLQFSSSNLHRCTAAAQSTSRLDQRALCDCCYAPTYLNSPSILERFM